METQQDMFPIDPDELESMLAQKSVKLMQMTEELEAVTDGYREPMKELRADIKTICKRLDDIQKQADH